MQASTMRHPIDRDLWAWRPPPKTQAPFGSRAIRGAMTLMVPAR